MEYVDIQDFRNSPIGELVAINGTDGRTGIPYNHFAYVPHPLPAEIQLSQPTIRKMGEADRALGALNARIRLLPNPQLLVRPALRLEAKSTAALEGTFATLEEVLQADYFTAPTRAGDLKEITNYVEAATEGIRLIQGDHFPISRRVLTGLQQMLVHETRGDSFDAGSLRTHQVFIGDEGQPVERARFVPPPGGDLLEQGFSDWERWINETGNALPLIGKLALTHYQFETLHPFTDGNGRLGRLIITLQLIESGELDYPILNLSAWFEPRRTQYIDALRQVSITGDFDAWVRIFSDAVKARCLAALNTINDLLQFRDRVTQQVRDAGNRGAVLQVVEFLTGYPLVSISDLQKLLDVSFQTAQRSVEKLQEMGIVREITGGEYGRLYYANEVAQIISRSETVEVGDAQDPAAQ
jgi:Fic family protein